MRSIVSVVAVLVFSSSAVAEDGWKDWADPGETVTMQVPADWRAGKVAERDGSRVVRFRLPDDGAELMLSIVPGLRRPGELPASIVKPYFPAGATFAGPSTSRGKGWLGLRQEATSRGDGHERAWLGQFYVFGSTLVALTLGDDATRIDAHREQFERVVKSVRYREAPVDTASREQGRTVGAAVG